MMKVVALYRYPVKSMLGERLDAVEIDGRGLVGDRLWAIVTADGRLGSGKSTRRFRRLDPLFSCRAVLAADGLALLQLPDGTSLRVDAPDVGPRLSRHCGEAVRCVREGELRRSDGSLLRHQDAGQVSIVGTETLRALAARIGDPEAIDPRRFRVNLVVETEQPWEEESWVGHHLAVGEVLLAGAQRVERCRTIDSAQGQELAADGRLLKALAADRGGCLALYADVVRPGRVALGAALRLLGSPPVAG